MKTNRSAIGILFRTEFRMVLRDRRVLLTAILLPVLVMPLMLAGGHWTLKRRQARLREAVYRYVVSGDLGGVIRPLLSQSSPPNRSFGNTEASGLPDTNAASIRQTNSQPRARFEETKSEDPMTALQEGTAEIIIEATSQPGNSLLSASATLSEQSKSSKPEGAGKKSRNRTSARTDPDGSDEDTGQIVPGAPIVRIIFRADRDLSATAATRAGDLLREARRIQRGRLLRARGFPIPTRLVAQLTETDIASTSQVAGLALGRSLTLALMFLILTGGAVVAMDSIAGEKERGTLETILTTSASRADVIGAKLLVIVCIALIITVIQSANLLLYVGLKLVPIPLNFAAAISPLKVVLLFILFLPVAALAASVQLLISGQAKSYKEAQMYFFPVFILGLVPALAPLLPGLTLRSVVVLVPIANIALSVREILIGNFDWPFVLLSWLLTLAAAGWTTSMTIRSLSNERLITSSESAPADARDRSAVFARHVLVWFAVMWALLLIVSNYLQKADIRWQIFLNLVVIFFGASCMMLRRYRLDVRETLSLRMPKPAIWLAVLVGVPSGLLAASGLFRLANYFIPISPKLMQQFDEAVIPPGMGLAQLIFFVAIMPAIFEEITFRGLLLHGLRRRFHPAITVLLVGVIFGLFHVALFRFAPTALLGIILAALVLLTDSIFPAMLWHGLSNAASLLAFKLGLPMTDLDPVSYLLGTAILAVALWIVWRNRRREDFKAQH
jgi:sodium transport system permease protein